jgi:hypothetical protein
VRYRKRPVEIEAVRLRWSTWGEVCELIERHCRGELMPAGREISAAEASDTCGEVGPAYIALDVMTVHGERAVVRHGDWLIPDATPGTFYPCKPDIFEATYSLVSDDGAGEAVSGSGGCAADDPALSTSRSTTDPRELGGDIAGPGDPMERNSVVFDTRQAVLLDGVVMAVMHGETSGDVAGVLLEGRVNRSSDRARVLFIMDGDGVASLITEGRSLVHRARRGGLDAIADQVAEGIRERSVALRAQGLL